MAKRYDVETVPLDPVRGVPTIVDVPTDGLVVIPGGGLLSEAIYARHDNDLLIELADGSRMVVSGYFDLESPPPLASEAGAHVSADVISALAGDDIVPIAPEVPVTAPIGRVEATEGEVTIVRADGSHVDAEAGALIGRGDRVETSGEGSAGFLFADESTFSLGGSGRAIFEDLVFDPESATAHATFVVQQGTFSFAGGGISAIDGAFAIKTPSATINVDGASGAGLVERDGATTVTYLRHEDTNDGILKIANPAGSEFLEESYEAVVIEDFFTRPSGTFRLGPRDTAEHFGDAVSALPDASVVMPSSLLGAQRGADPATQALRADDPSSPAPGDNFATEIQVDRDTAFEIAARKAAIAQSAREAAEEAIRDAEAAEQVARQRAESADAVADEKSTDAEALRARALEVLEESERREKAFEEALRRAEETASREEQAARDVAETDIAEGQAAERLAAAEEAVRKALEAAERARNEALEILEEVRAKEEAFAAAQEAALQAKEEEEARALAVAEADAAEDAAAAALRAADAAAALAEADALAAERVAAEAGTAAEIVETVVERELAAIDPELLNPPANNQIGLASGDWSSNTNASMDVIAESIAAGQRAAREAFQTALDNGLTTSSAMDKAIEAAEAYGGAAAMDRVIAGGPDGLLGTSDDDEIMIAGGEGGFVGGDAGAGAVGTDVLIGGGAEDGFIGGFAGTGGNGVDGIFGFNFAFTPITVDLTTPNLRNARDDDEVVVLAAQTIADNVSGSGLADFLVGTNDVSTIGGLEGDDFIYGDTPTNYLSGTHNISNTLTNPTFAAGGNDLISGGAGADSIWGGAGADTLYGDVPTNTSGFDFGLGSATAGADDLYGGDGNDTLIGGGAADTLSGEGGDDTFIMGDDDGANDTVWGGDSAADAGIDTVDYSDAGAAVNINLNTGSATGSATGTDTLSGIENAVGTSFDDTITGSADANTLSGGGGADTVYGLENIDNIFGYADDDVLIGGQGDDTLTGGTGADTFQFEGGVGATTEARVSSLGHDIINDYNMSESDLFILSDGDFALGAAGTLTDGVNYFEATDTVFNGTPQDLSSGVANAGIVILGENSGGGGADAWYTSDASAMTDSNSYQVATVSGADRSTIDAGDFSLKS